MLGLETEYWVAIALLPVAIYILGAIVGSARTGTILVGPVGPNQWFSAAVLGRNTRSYDERAGDIISVLSES